MTKKIAHRTYHSANSPESVELRRHVFPLTKTSQIFVQRLLGHQNWDKKSLSYDSKTIVIRLLQCRLVQKTWSCTESSMVAQNLGTFSQMDCGQSHKSALQTHVANLGGALVVKQRSFTSDLDYWYWFLFPRFKNIINVNWFETDLWQCNWCYLAH